MSIEAAPVLGETQRNLYDGIVELDADGAATVELPPWFDAVNGDIRYQLTCVGGCAPVYVSDEVTRNRFRIAGGRPGLKVSWQLTGVRRDSYAKAHPMVVEEIKNNEESGRFQNPVEHGAPAAMGIHSSAFSSDGPVLI